MNIVEYNEHIVANNLPAYILTQQLIQNVSDNALFIPKFEEQLYDSTYTRTMYAPKDSIVIGRMHKQATYNVVLEGELIIHMMGKVVYVKAGDTFVTPPLCKKVGRMITDVKFLNIFSVDKGSSLENILDEVTFTEEEETIFYKESLCQEQ